MLTEEEEEWVVIVPMPDIVSYTVNKARRTDYCVFIFYFLALIFSIATLILGTSPYLSPSPQTNQILDLITPPCHWSPILSIFTSIFSALFSSTAAAISTALYCSYRNFFEDREEIHINGALGRNMFAVMWAASIIAMASSVVRVMYGCWNPERIRDGRGGELLKIVRRIHVPRVDPV